MTRRTGVTLALAALLVAVAAGCRFALFDLIEFKYDEAQVSSLALDLVRRHLLPQTSIATSGGFQNPPIMVYLAAIPMLVSASPLTLTGFFTALNALTAGGLYLVARRFAGEMAAIVAALLYALSPLAVHYSRKIWAPDAMPPFTLLLVAGLTLGLGEGQGWWLAAALVALGVLIQLHQAAIILLPVTALLIAAFAHRLCWRRAASWGGLLVGLIAFVLLLAPYALYEWRHGLADLRGMASQVGSHPALTAAPWRDLWWLAAGWNPSLFFAPLVAQERITLVGSGVADWLTLLLAVAGAGACLFWLIRPDASWPAPVGRKGFRRLAAATVLLLTLSPPLVITRSAAPVYPHYLVFLTPLLFLLVGVGASSLAVALANLPINRQATFTKPARSRLGPITQHPPAVTSPLSGGFVDVARRFIGGYASFALLSIVALFRLVGFDRQLAAHVTGGDYGTPLRYTLQAAQALQPRSGNGANRTFILASDGDTIAVYRYLAAAHIAPSAAVVQPEQALPLPAAGSTSYLFRTTDTAAYQALRAIAPAAFVAFPAIAAPTYTVATLSPSPPMATEPGALAALPSVGPFSVGPGLTLTASRVSLAGSTGPLQVTLAWSVQDPALFAKQPVRVFVHLYDNARHTVAQDDALGYASADWQPGDRLLTWFTATPQPAPLTPGRYTLVAGVYIVDGFHDFPVRGPQGQDLGGEIPLGIVTVR